MSRIGIVIPAHNAIRYLPATVESVLDQTFVDWQCVIVENNSTDATPAMVESMASQHARIRTMRLPNSRGVSDGRNAGIDALPDDVELIICLDADDLWTPDALAKLVSALDNRPDAAAVHATATFIGPDGGPFDASTFELDPRSRLTFVKGRISTLPGTADTTFESLSTWPGVITPGLVLIRRDAFVAAGRYDGTITHGEDWDLWLRLVRLAPLAYLNEPLLRYRRHPQNSNSHGNRRAMMARVRQKIRDDYADTPARKQHARAAYKAVYRMLARQRFAKAACMLAKLQPKSAARTSAQAMANLIMSCRG